ncbi:MAG: flagellar hook-associated protein FlgK [Nannocystaceae bacterium]|nr:flagellar hook-associated protein FlgK [bacterium]
MTSLIGLLGLGGRAYGAHSAGVATIGNNVSNVSTEGYSRQRVDLSANLILGGVRADGAFRAEDFLLSMQERDNAGSLGFASSSTSALLGLDGALSLGPSALPEQISNFFDGLNALQGSPLDGARQQDVVQRANAMAESFSEAANSISGAGHDAQFRANLLAEQANELANTIANANETLALYNDPALADKRDLAAAELAELVGGQARIDSDGKMRFVANGGAVLVDGNTVNALSVTTDPANPAAVTITAGTGAGQRDVTQQLGAGRLGGEVEFITGTIADSLAQLDQLAFDLATALNGVHASAQASDGTTGLPLFDIPVGPAGAASAISVNQVIVDDPSLLATGTLGEPAGDIGGVTSLLSVREALTSGGGTRTATDEAIHLLAGIGRLATDAQSAQDLHTARGDMLAASRDALSGVSIEEEMLRLSEFQRAAEAASTFVSTVDQMLANLISTL